LNFKARTNKIRYRGISELFFKSIRKIEIHENEIVDLTQTSAFFDQGLKLSIQSSVFHCSAAEISYPEIQIEFYTVI